MEGAGAQAEPLVSCPVCLRELPAACINSHLDRCLQEQAEGGDDKVTERAANSSCPEEETGTGPQQPYEKKMRLSKSPEASCKEELGSSLNTTPVFSLFHKGRGSGAGKPGTPRAVSLTRSKEEEKQLDGESSGVDLYTSAPELSGESLAQKLEGKPLADKLRPNTLRDYVGQNKVLGEQTLLRSLLDAHEIPSLILWGPPGCGKTTLAHIIAHSSKKNSTRFVTLSATSAKTNDVREVIAQAQNEKRLFKRKTILFIDEIHRFNKSQQDTFLPHVECGTVTLIGATTENPSFQVNSALLSRCRVIVLEKLSVEAMEAILMRAVRSLGIQILSQDEPLTGSVNGSNSKSSESCVCIERTAINTLAYLCDGDARTGLNGLQMAVQAKLTKLPHPSNMHGCSNGMVIKEEHVKEGLQRSHILYDRADQMSAKRKSYSVEYKKGIVEDTRGKNLTAYCKENKLDLRLVRKWRAEYDNLSQQVEKGNAKKRKCGSGRHPLFPELEDIISDWIADRRTKTLVVRRADIQEFALSMAAQLEISPEDFKASQRWLDDFLQRYELSLRRSTALFKLEDAEVIKRALAFKSFVDGINFSKYQLSNMIALDETTVYMGQGSQTTIDHRGASSIYVPSTGYESARVSCILAIHLDGKKAPPLIVTKGKKDEIERVSGIYVLETEKAWCTQAVLRKWVDLMLPLVLRDDQRGLLVWDSASTHRAKDMKKFLAERRIDPVMIPAGMTAYLQTFDIAINKPFKDHLHMQINDYIEKRMERNQHGNFVKPSLQEVVTWVKNSWDEITDSCVANALRAGYLDRKYSFKESCIAGHERLGSMILQAMEESEEIQAGTRGLEHYDDIPEEDDVIVFE